MMTMIYFLTKEELQEKIVNCPYQVADNCLHSSKECVLLSCKFKRELLLDNYPKMFEHDIKFFVVQDKLVPMEVT